MRARTIEEQLVKYLADAHAIEEQALVQMRRAPELAGVPELARAFSTHLEETEEHEALIRERLSAHESEPSAIKDTVMKAGGAGFALFAKVQPDTPGKLAAHAYSYEHLELAAYELLARVAGRAEDSDCQLAAQQIRDQEQAMADRLADLFDVAVDASLSERGGDDVEADLVKYLADAHAIEEQSLGLLKRAAAHASPSELRHLADEHLRESEGHRRRIEERLAEHGSKPSTLVDATMRLGALNWTLFFRAQPDTPGKLTAFMFAFEHLEIAGYEQLTRVAAKAGDRATVEMGREILAQEREAAKDLSELFDIAIDASLDAQGVPRSTADVTR
jgi:ferritin-like metal-binding protein YciE